MKIKTQEGKKKKEKKNLLHMGGNININPPFFYEIAYPFQ